jgi:hypothetical protein
MGGDFFDPGQRAVAAVHFLPGIEDINPLPHPAPMVAVRRIGDVCAGLDEEAEVDVAVMLSAVIRRRVPA